MFQKGCFFIYHPPYHLIAYQGRHVAQFDLELCGGAVEPIWIPVVEVPDFLVLLVAQPVPLGGGGGGAQNVVVVVVETGEEEHLLLTERRRLNRSRFGPTVTQTPSRNSAALFHNPFPPPTRNANVIQRPGRVLGEG